MLFRSSCMRGSTHTKPYTLTRLLFHGRASLNWKVSFVVFARECFTSPRETTAVPFGSSIILLNFRNSLFFFPSSLQLSYKTWISIFLFRNWSSVFKFEPIYIKYQGKNVFFMNPWFSMILFESSSSRGSVDNNSPGLMIAINWIRSRKNCRWM